MALTTLAPLAMEELMSVVKILLPAVVIATTMGSVVAYSYVYRSLSVALIAASDEDLAIPPQPAKDDALKGDPSWAR
jgi:hypothetical protein